MKKNDEIILGGGCFWCVEAVFQSIKGVLEVQSGYAGGQSKNPTYEEVCSGGSGHAEVVKITFDSESISLDDIFYIFFRTHDPTTLNKQGADVGTQYRSIILYNSEEQRLIAEKSKKRTDEEKLWPHPIVTEITALTDFYPAEPYHQDYYKLNRSQPYCQFVIDPKIQKLKKEFKSKIVS